MHTAGTCTYDEKGIKKLQPGSLIKKAIAAAAGCGKRFFDFRRMSAFDEKMVKTMDKPLKIM